ncbi:MAG TPA: histidine phosphatase family protein [Opitutus sp.]|nr:histidine phosphatase family protein [Opitutus sp.]
MNTRVYLIRHGETAWSLDGRHTGLTEQTLTARGEEETRKLGMRLPKDHFAQVWSSPRIRARRSTELTGLAAAMEIDPELAEWIYGDYEGLRTAEIRKTRPGWSIFRDGCPGGETPAQIGARADRVITRLRAIDGAVAIFTHGHFGRVLGARWIGLDVAVAAHLLLGTTSLSILDWNSQSSPEASIVLWNGEAEHLCDIQAPLGDTRSMKERALQRWENEGGEISPPGSGAAN